MEVVASSASGRVGDRPQHVYPWQAYCLPGVHSSHGHAPVGTRGRRGRCGTRYCCCWRCILELRVYVWSGFLRNTLRGPEELWHDGRSIDLITLLAPPPCKCILSTKGVTNNTVIFNRFFSHEWELGVNEIKLEQTMFPCECLYEWNNACISTSLRYCGIVSCYEH